MEQPKTGLRTALYNHHVALGAKIVSFAGWEMPLFYQGITAEHCAVRERVGLFDVSHMGRLFIRGKEAARFLDHLSTNSVAGKGEGTATYTVWSLPEGGCVDDLLVYRQAAQIFFVVVNAANRERDLHHLQQQSRGFDVVIEPHYSGEGILALQGPKAPDCILRLFPETETLLPMHFLQTSFLEEPLTIARSGYTGEKGFEFYGSERQIVPLWEALLESGKPYGIAPVGLGARDTLRLEMGYALYGHEISESISANESVSAWTIKWQKENFVGKRAMQALESSGAKRSAYGVMLVEPGIARAGYEVFHQGTLIGCVTSGTQSPTLHQAIALILVTTSLHPGDEVTIQIRQQQVRARVVKLPFIGLSK
jgi:aminomethyltransferase